MKKVIPILIAVIIAGGAGFYLGKISAGSPTQNIAAGYGQNGGQFRNSGNGQRNGMNGGLANGDVINKDDKSITVQMRDGSSKIVFFSSSTQVMKSAGGSLGDVITGEQVTVIGTSNSDGSITAQTIQIRPALGNSSSTRQ
ncbi:MAG: hypothetical protein ABSE68_03470 [Minisyncoccia bacterium]